MREIEQDAVIRLFQEMVSREVHRLVYLSVFELRMELLQQLGLNMQASHVKLAVENALFRSNLNWTVLGCPPMMDMFFTFMNEGKLDPKIKMVLPEPGMPGQPMYFVIPKKASNPEEAKKFVGFITSPAIQAKEIVMRFNWYPGIDGSQLKGSIPQDVFDKIYGDVTPADLAKKGRAFPLADYFSAILEGYEKWVK